LLGATATALRGIRGLKSGRKLSMRSELNRVEVSGPPDALGLLALSRDDLVAAGRVRELVLQPGSAAELSISLGETTSD
jgi:valyl-tRNA synthetase